MQVIIMFDSVLLEYLSYITYLKEGKRWILFCWESPNSPVLGPQLYHHMVGIFKNNHKESKKSCMFWELIYSSQIQNTSGDRH